MQNLTQFIVSGTSYDAVWAMALGLNVASERVNNNDSSGCGHLPGELVPLENFTYKNEMMGCVLFNSFQQVNFSGITVSHHSRSLIALAYNTHIILDIAGDGSIQQ